MRTSKATKGIAPWVERYHAFLTHSLHNHFCMPESKIQNLRKNYIIDLEAHVLDSECQVHPCTHLCNAV